MNIRKLIKQAGIELESSGFNTYAEFVSLDEFNLLICNIRKEERDMVLGNVLEILRGLDTNSGGIHNYFGYAANIIEQNLGNE